MGGHVGRFSKFWLCQQLFAFNRFCMETVLSNILKTAKATKFIKIIVESTNKIIVVTGPTRPVFSLRVVEF